MARKQQNNTSTPLTGVITARYSSHAQRDVSIEQQIEECEAYAAANNIEIVAVYADRALTGRSDKRPEFQKMMRHAENKQFDVIIAYKSDRMARNMLQALIYEDKLANLGIQVLYVKEEFGNTAAGRFSLRTMMNVNQFYSENMSENIKRGMLYNAQNCLVNGALPLGYIKGDNGEYVVDEAAAAVVREIFSRVLAGESYVEISDALNSRGIRTRGSKKKPGNKWNKGSFHRMLVNDAYIGVYRHSGVVVEDGIPPILEKGVFYAMQEYLRAKKNPRGRSRENGEYLLTGKLFCGYCKSPMVGISGTGKSGTKHYYYICNKRRTEANCQKGNVRRDWIEQLVAELTQEYILRDDAIEWIAESAVRFHAEAMKTAGLSTMEEDLSESRKAAKNIVSAIEKGIITATTKDRLIELEFEIADLERIITLTKAMDRPIEKDKIIYTLEQMRAGDVESKAYQKRLIDTFVRAIYLRDDKIRIDYYYAGRKNSITRRLAKGNTGEVDADGFVQVPPASTIVPHRRTF